MTTCENCDCCACFVASVPRVRHKPAHKRLCVECFNLYQYLYGATVVQFDRSAWEAA